ncbi:MAG: AAA domain-containing protein [Bulleidia sp.]
MEVIHLSKYGEGKIIRQTEKKITVVFHNESDPKMFMYPDAFLKFMKLKDDELNAQLNLELSQKNDAVVLEKNEEIPDNDTSEEEEVLTKKPRKISVPSYHSVEDFCEAYEASIAVEMNYIQKNGGKKYRVHDVVRIDDAGKVNTIYTCESEIELNLPIGIEVTAWNSDGYSKGTIVDCDEFTVILSLETDYGKLLDELEFSVNPWMLMNALIERLKEMSVDYSGIARSLILDGLDNIFYGYDYIDQGQERAVAMSMKQPITFIWGPPGTGKTQTLAKTAIDHIRQGEQVLMLSYSNVSVDGAALRVFHMMHEPKRRTVLRYGYPREKEILDHPYLSSYNCVLSEYPYVLKQRDELLEEKKKVPKDSERAVTIARELNALRNHIKDLEKNLVKRSLFVATTVSKAIMDSAVYQNSFDVVIFDEASMAYIPQLAFSANLAQKRFICIGDFKQLPPIVQSSNVSKLNADIFQHAKVDYAVDNRYGHDWLCLLNQQYRMHPDIASFVSENMYHGLLKSADGMVEKTRHITEAEPFSGMPLVLADLSGMMSVCTTLIDKSHVNLLSALITFSLALKAAKENEVGIITPYAAQSRLLQSMIRDLKETENDLKPIESATVHQFQGSEKDVIIYDAVDCYRLRNPGVMLTSTLNNNANRLFNVAMTRAKGKFICVANVDYMKKKISTPGLVFPKLIRKLTEENKMVKADGLYENGSYAQVMQFFNQKEGFSQFISEIKQAKKKINIEIPDCVLYTPEIEKLAKQLSEKMINGVEIKIRTENMTTLPKCLCMFAEENQYLANPVTIIDQKIVWFGLPYSSAEFVSEGKRIQTTNRPIIRFEGKYTARAVYSSLEIGRKIKTKGEMEETDE